MSTHYLLDHASPASGSGHSDAVWDLKWASTTSGTGLVVTGSADSSVKVWDPSEPEEPRRTLVAESGTVALGILSIDTDPSPSRPRYVVSNSIDSKLRRWKIGGEQSAMEAQKQMRPAESWSIALHPSPSNELLAINGEAARVKVVKSSVEGFGEELFSVDGRGEFGMAVSYSPNGTLIASSSDTGYVSLIDAETGTLLQVFSAHSSTIRTLTFSPDSSLLITGSDDNRINVFDVRNASSRSSGDDYNGSVSTGGRRGMGGHVMNLGGHTGWVVSLACRGDGKVFASGSSDGTIKIWDLSHPSSALSTLSDSTSGGEVWSLSWRPEAPGAPRPVEGLGGPGLGGGALVSGSEDGVVRWWRSTGGG